MKKPITLKMAIEESMNTPELIEQYERLKKVKLFPNRSPIAMMIDEATGYHGLVEKDWKDFFDFVRDYIWLPVVLQNYKK